MQTSGVTLIMMKMEIQEVNATSPRLPQRLHALKLIFMNFGLHLICFHTIKCNDPEIYTTYLPHKTHYTNSIQIRFLECVPMNVCILIVVTRFSSLLKLKTIHD